MGSAHQRLIVGCRWWVGLPQYLWTSAAVCKDLHIESTTLLPRKAHFKLTLPQVCYRSGGRYCWPCWCRLHVSLLQVVSLPLVPGRVCVGLGVKGLSLCSYVKVTCLHSRAPQAHLLVACWCSQRGLHRTICHPAAVMIPSVLPCRPLSLLWSHHSLLPPAGCVTLC